jgi:hypothetical protein
MQPENKAWAEVLVVMKEKGTDPGKREVSSTMGKK